MTLPYISDKGPRKSGPIAYARTKMDSVKDSSTWFVMLNSWAMAVRAGATMEEETGEMNVNDETTDYQHHFS